MFIFKKLVAQLISPISLTLILILVGLILISLTSKAKFGKALILTGTIFLAFCSFTRTSDLLIKPLKNYYPPFRSETILADNLMPKFIAVLGSGYTSDPSIPVISRIGHDSLIQLVEAVRIYRMIPGIKLLLPGSGANDSRPGKQDLAQLAEELGVDKEDIIIESKSRDTKDQARFMKSILGNDYFIMVTSASHMPRSVSLFKKLGMKPIPAPTISMEGKILYRNPNPFFPSSVNLQKAELAIHEYLGMVWAKMRQQI